MDAPIVPTQAALLLRGLSTEDREAFLRFVDTTHQHHRLSDPAEAQALLRLWRMHHQP